MTDAEPKAGDRIVEVSAETLSLIFPGGGPGTPKRPPSRFRRWWTDARLKLRLIWTRARFKNNDFQGLRCRWAAVRLRAKLMWLRIRHRGRLPR